MSRLDRAYTSNPLRVLLILKQVYATRNVDKIGLRAHTRACIYCRFKITLTSEGDVVEAILFESLRGPKRLCVDRQLKRGNTNNRTKNHEARASLVKASSLALRVPCIRLTCRPTPGRSRGRVARGSSVLRLSPRAAAPSGP